MMKLLFGLFICASAWSAPLYYENYDEAVAAALHQRRHLIVWVALNPGTRSDLANDLSREALHCLLPTFLGDNTPRIVIQGADDRNYFIRAEKIGPNTANVV